LAHGEKRIKYWVLGRKRDTKGSISHGLKQKKVFREAQQGSKWELGQVS